MTDQLSVWIDQKYDEVDEVDSEGQDDIITLSQSTSGTSSSGTNLLLAYSDPYMAEQLRKKALLPTSLEQVIEENVEKEVEIEEEEVIEEEVIREEEVIAEEEEVIEGEAVKTEEKTEPLIQEEEKSEEIEEEEPITETQTELEEKTEEQTDAGLTEEEEEEVVPDELEHDGRTSLEAIPELPSEEAEETAAEEEVEVEVQEEIIEDKDTTSDIYGMNHDILEGLLDGVFEQGRDMEEGGELVAAGSSIPLKSSIAAVEIKDRTPSKIEEHSPDMICCVSLKIWATWLLEVAHNSHGWCRWITDVIGQIRLFGAILRGEVKNEDGSTRILYKEEWEQFKEMLERDIATFRQYNSQIQELSIEIIKNYDEKSHVACCPACLNLNLILSEEAGSHVVHQLSEAIETASNWRRWLDSLVTLAERLSLLRIDLLPSTSLPIETTSLVAPFSQPGSYDIIEIQSPNDRSQLSSRSSSESYFIIEEMDQ